MSLLRILRNLAVLVILTVAALSLNPRPVAAQSSCQPLGGFCSVSRPCCPSSPRSLCGRHNMCCNKPLRGMTCSGATDSNGLSIECCSGFCFNGACQ